MKQKNHKGRRSEILPLGEPQAQGVTTQKPSPGKQPVSDRWVDINMVVLDEPEPIPPKLKRQQH